MRFLLVFAALGMSGVASAEVRLFNGTGKELTFDLLHADSKIENQKLPATRGLSEVFGVPLERNEAQTLVVRDASGKEILRDDVKSDCIHVLAMWGDSLVVENLGYYKGENSDPSSIRIINSSGKELKLEAERADFSKVQESTRSPRHPQAVVFVDLSNLAPEPGVEKTVTITGIGAPKEPVKMLTGGVYHISQGGKVEMIEKSR